MATAVERQLYAEADVFIARFLSDNPDLTMGEASARAFHAARTAGFPLAERLYIEAKVFGAVERQVAELKRQRGEWLYEFQQAGAR